MEVRGCVDAVLIRFLDCFWITEIGALGKEVTEKSLASVVSVSRRGLMETLDVVVLILYEKIITFLRVLQAM